MSLPTVPVSGQALVRATCDGTGLITLSTPNGPEHFACDGCRSCTTREQAPSQHYMRLREDPFCLLPVVEDVEW